MSTIAKRDINNDSHQCIIEHMAITADVAKCCQPSTNDCRLLITPTVQLCVQRGGHLGVTQHHMVRRHQLIFVHSL